MLLIKKLGPANGESYRFVKKFLLFPSLVTGVGFVWLETVEVRQLWCHGYWINMEMRRIPAVIEGPPGAQGIPGPAGPTGPRGPRCKCVKGKKK